MIAKRKFSDYEEFLLLSRFQNIIIANSTFSFWPALAGPTKKSKVAPSKWTHISEDNRIWINNLEKFEFITIS